jgi:hypothetical protein
MRAGLLALSLLAAGAATAGLALAAEAQGRHGWPSPRQLARQFELVAFSSEYGGQYRAGHLIRWRGVVQVRLTGQVEPAFRAEVERQLAQLHRASGLVFVLSNGVEEGPPRGITIEFSRSRGGTTFEPDAPCRTLIWESGYVIQRAQIYIVPFPAWLRHHCIAEEITQSLGLAADTGYLPDSIYNDSSARQRIAPWDELMVRILYHPSLRPGMTIAEARPLIRRIIARLTGRIGTSSGRRHR